MFIRQKLILNFLGRMEGMNVTHAVIVYTEFFLCLDANEMSYKVWRSTFLPRVMLLMTSSLSMLEFYFIICFYF